ncbi:MAG: Bax inhibitor-1/YccA family protein [Deltaproteobacteria bacterium]|nr:Bax inhibitor-1/YccA family protein [Deltaproteobacteria bacterium]
MRTANPALNKKTFAKAHAGIIPTGEVMTLNGTVNKSIMLLGILVISALWPWYKFFSFADPAVAQSSVMGFLIGGLIGGLIFAMITIFRPKSAAITAPIYAILEGLFLGAISAVFESMYPGIVIQAIALTFGIFFALLMAYKSGLIKATENFKLGIVAATGGIFIVYMATMVLGFFGVNIPYIHGSGIVGIGFSLFVVVIAALNLVLDFDFIEHGAETGEPKYMEWYAAFGLIVTLVWLYIELLRLLSKLHSRN